MRRYVRSATVLKSTYLERYVDSGLPVVQNLNHTSSPRQSHRRIPHHARPGNSDLMRINRQLVESERSYKMFGLVGCLFGTEYTLRISRWMLKHTANRSQGRFSSIARHEHAA